MALKMRSLLPVVVGLAGLLAAIHWLAGRGTTRVAVVAADASASVEIFEVPTPDGAPSHGSDAGVMPPSTAAVPDAGARAARPTRPRSRPDAAPVVVDKEALWRRVEDIHLSKWFPLDQVPRARAILSDMCDQMDIIMGDMIGYSIATATDGGPVDVEVGGAAIREASEVRRQAVTELKALPGSRFEARYFVELRGDPDLGAVCRYFRAPEPD